MNLCLKVLSLIIKKKEILPPPPSIVLTCSKNGEIHISQGGEIGEIPKSAKFRIREIGEIPPENSGKLCKMKIEIGEISFLGEIKNNQFVEYLTISDVYALRLR